MPHLDTGLIHALLDGEIPSTELPPLQSHLARCAECRGRVDTERALLEEAVVLIDQLQISDSRRKDPARRAVSARRGARHRWWPAAWAATVLLAAGLGYVWRGSRDGTVRPNQPVVVADAAPPESSAKPLPEPGQEPRSASGTRQTVLPKPATRGAARAAERRHDEPARAAIDSAAAGIAGPAEPMAPKTVAQASADAAPAPRSALAAPPLPSNRLDEVTGRAPGAPARAFGGLIQPAPVEISLSGAMERLGGSLRLIEGMVPRRLEAVGTTVRVVYAVGGGEVILSQQLVGGRVSWTLRGDPAVPAGTLEALRARVR